MINKEEHIVLKACLLKIEEKLGWGKSSKWHSDVFIELSEIIRVETNVLLSPTTLKRVWGKVNYNSFPSISTLNTLAKFAEYENWRDFKNNYSTKKSSFIQKKVVPYLGIIVPSAAVLTLVFISFFSMTGIKKRASNKSFDHITFSSNPITKGLPNSVVFDLNIEGISSDSIYIQQFWDKTKTIKLRSDQKQATGIYYYPGYFRSKLLIDGEIIKEHDLFIKSHGWVGTVDYRPIPKYISNNELKSGRLSLPKAIVKEVSNNENPINSSFHYIEDFKNTSGDNLFIKTRVRNVYNDKWATCQTLRFVILGTEGALIIPFTKLGCVSNINLMMNDYYLSGKENDLSAFGVDLSHFRDISIKIVDKNVSIIVDAKKIYQASYNESIGNFVGIRYRFLGAGDVESLEILDQNTNKQIHSN